MYNEAIDPEQPLGQHIALRCNNCDARYHTKNIGWIGARTIFAVDTVCPCPMSNLEVVK